jgi:hypothetical protein
MIINLICGDFIFTTNINQWNKIKGIISCAIKEYIIDYKNNIIIHHTELTIPDNDNCFSNETQVKEYNYYQNTLYEKSVNKEEVLNSINSFLNEIQIMNYCLNPMKNLENNEIFLLNIYKKYLDLLTLLGLAGIFSLNNINKVNCLYSIGTCYDIANAIDLILPFINDELVEYLLFDILLIFNHSVKNNLLITITLDKNNKLENDNKINSITKNLYKKGSLSYILYLKKIKN